MDKIPDNFYNPNLYQSAGCIFQAYGKGFEPELFLLDTTFDSKLVLFKGKLGLPANSKGKTPNLGSELEIFEIPFLLLEVSKAEGAENQLTDAFSFLKQYRNEIQRLQNFPQVESISLQFLVAESDMSLDLQKLPDEFSELACKIGITDISSRTANFSI